MKKRCPVCNGTGVERCEVHGSHTCSRCNGEGCVYDDLRFPKSTKPWCN